MQEGILNSLTMTDTKFHEGAFDVHCESWDQLCVTIDVTERNGECYNSYAQILGRRALRSDNGSMHERSIALRISRAILRP